MSLEKLGSCHAGTYGFREFRQFPDWAHTDPGWEKMGWWTDGGPPWSMRVPRPMGWQRGTLVLGLIKARDGPNGFPSGVTGPCHSVPDFWSAGLTHEKDRY